MTDGPQIVLSHALGPLGLVGNHCPLRPVDLDDKTVHGGTMDGWWMGVNWWATRRLKMSICYGDINLDRFGIQGNTKTVLSRLQWIY